MIKQTLANYYPGSNQSNDNHNDNEMTDNPEKLVKQLYRELGDLKVRNEFLEQCIRDSKNGLLTDEKLLNDYQDLKSKVEEQQQLITSQNEMLDEAQLLLQQLRNECDTLRSQVNTQSTMSQSYESIKEENHTLKQEIKGLQQSLMDAHDQIDYLSSRRVLSSVPEVSDEETDYSFIQDELQGCMSWILKMEDILHLSPDLSSTTLSKRLEAIYNRLPVGTSLIENSYLSLIQSEVNELFVLVEGSSSSPSPIKQIHTIQNTVQAFLSEYQVSCLKEYKPVKPVEPVEPVEPTEPAVDWSSLYIQIQEIGKEVKESELPKSQEDFIKIINSNQMEWKKKEESLLSIVSSFKQECADSLVLNQNLYKECNNYKATIQKQNEQIEKLQEKAKKVNQLKEKYQRAVEEIKNRGILITQYQQFLIDHGFSVY